VRAVFVYREPNVLSDVQSCYKTNWIHYLLKFIFGIKLYMFRTVPLSIIRSFSLYTQQWFMCWQLSANLYDIYHCCVYSEKLLMMDRNCPKHVEFYCKNKFQKLTHLVDFIIRIYHDARSPERQTVPGNSTLTHVTYLTPPPHNRYNIVTNKR